MAYARKINFGQELGMHAHYFQTCLLCISKYSMDVREYLKVLVCGLRFIYSCFLIQWVPLKQFIFFRSENFHTKIADACPSVGFEYFQCLCATLETHTIIYSCLRPNSHCNMRHVHKQSEPGDVKDFRGIMEAISTQIKTITAAKKWIFSHTKLAAEVAVLLTDVSVNVQYHDFHHFIFHSVSHNQ